MAAEERTLLFQGAEARVYLVVDRGASHPSRTAAEFSPLSSSTTTTTTSSRATDHDKFVVKERFSKRYRHEELDARLTKRRFGAEVKALAKCAKLGIDVPRVREADKERVTYAMDFVEGKTAKHCFNETERTVESKLIIAREIGIAVAKLHHVAGMVHGDLTTSNMIIRTSPKGDDEDDDVKLCLIDFGLSQPTHSVEDFAVDLYVLERAFLSTHVGSQYLFDRVLESYVAYDPAKTTKVGTHLGKVRARGRKKLAFG